MAELPEINIIKLPPKLQRVREAALKALGALEPAGATNSSIEARGLMLASRTNGGRTLPEHYLVYFLLVDLLGFPNMGQWEKVAWTIPVRYLGRLYGVERRKMGLGIFAPPSDPKASMSTPPSEQAESDAREIAALITRAVAVAQPYFEWRAEQAATASQLNVSNKSIWLFERYEFFRDHFKALSDEAQRKTVWSLKKDPLDDRTPLVSGTLQWSVLRREAEWNAQAAIEAFFGWTEHAFIHLAILQGRLRSGQDLANLAEADWKTKFKSVLDITDNETKEHYDSLLDLRTQIRNFMAHGAFGKRGEAFHFHSGAGAVPVLLTGLQNHRYALIGKPSFDERSAIDEIEQFIEHLWSGSRLPARHYIFSSLPSILTLAGDGTYARAMQSEEDMKEFVDYLTHQFESVADMDW